MNQEILKICLEKGVLLDKEACNIISEFDGETARKFVDAVSSLKEKIITKSLISKNADKIENLIENKELIEKLRISFGITFEVTKEIVRKEEKKEIGFNNLKVVYSLANLTRKLEPEDFTRYFRNTYAELKKILQNRKELENLSSINKINGQRQNVSIIGMVYKKRISKNKNILLEVEDLAGRINVIANKNKAEVYGKAKEVLVDDVIGIKGVGNEEIIFANDIIYPDCLLPEKTTIERDERIAFISDIHVGSNNFLKENFLKFINWLNGEEGEEKQREEARKVKYLFVTGDNVDGVGIFPGQEGLLEIKDIKEQYNILAGYFSKIRKDVKIIVCPGQHDSVRVAEPQPFIGKDYGEALHNLENVLLVSNPAVIEICNGGKKGIKILMYHGASMNSYVNEIESLRLGKAHDNPSKVVREILKRRHLASLHSSVTYIPTEKENALIIKEVPDIINTADLHKADVDVYNNVLIICSSCWQSMTSFEEKVGNHPLPCKVPILNLKTREIKILDFSEEK